MVSQSLPDFLLRLGVGGEESEADLEAAAAAYCFFVVPGGGGIGGKLVVEENKTAAMVTPLRLVLALAALTFVVRDEREAARWWVFSTRMRRRVRMPWQAGSPLWLSEAAMLVMAEPSVGM